MAMAANQQNYTPEGGVPTNADWTGAWVDISQMDAIAFIAKLTGTGNPVAAWEADVTDYEVADKDPSPTPITMTSDMTAQNPAGNGAAINFLFQFDPIPRAKWMRFKYNRASAGSASNLLNISMNKKARG